MNETEIAGLKRRIGAYPSDFILGKSFRSCNGRVLFGHKLEQVTNEFFTVRKVACILSLGIGGPQSFVSPANGIVTIAENSREGVLAVFNGPSASAISCSPGEKIVHDVFSFLPARGTGCIDIEVSASTKDGSAQREMSNWNLI